MYCSVESTIVLRLLLVSTAYAVRISPKLDFGDSNPSAGFRQDTGIKYLRDSGGIKSNYRTEPTKLDNVEVICISGNCTTIKSATENTNGLSADVLVHIKTNVDVSKTKNDTVAQPVPDVPIVVGSKSTTLSTLDNNLPPTALHPVVYQANYPAVNLLPPISVDNPFIPSNRPIFIQDSQLHTDAQIRDYFGATNYAPRFQGSDNDIGVQTTYFGSPLIDNNNAQNNRPIGPRPAYYPRGVRGGNYNPVEFRKTYNNNNNWSPVKWSRSDPSNSDRRTGSGIPRWTPCVCQNPELHLNPTTPSYSQRNQPAGINGKLAPLV